MKTKMLKLARKLWSSPTVPMDANRRNMREWVRAVRVVGDNWKLAKYVERKEAA